MSERRVDQPSPESMAAATSSLVARDSPTGTPKLSPVMMPSESMNVTRIPPRDAESACAAEAPPSAISSAVSALSCVVTIPRVLVMRER